MVHIIPWSRPIRLPIAVRNSPNFGSSVDPTVGFLRYDALHSTSDPLLEIL